MKIGAHVSAAGGIFNAPDNAAKLGCEALQVFSRPPQGGPAPKLTDEIVGKFKSAMQRHGYKDFVIHTPYFINFASTTPRIRYGSISMVREELERGTLLGAAYVVTHLGSTKDAGKALGLHKTWRSIQRILDGYTGTAQLLMEISAGAGDSVGGTFGELAELLKNIESKAVYKNKVNVCLDTCHLFAAGYDISTPAKAASIIKEFDKIISLKHLKLFHANDSKAGLGEHKDRHEHIGKGQIGLAGFRALLHHPELKNLDMILETPWDNALVHDIKTLKKLRG